MPSPKERFLTVYGRQPVLEALADPSLMIDKVLVDEAARGGAIAEIERAARSRGVPMYREPAHRVHHLSGNGRHDQGVLADVVAPRMSSLATALEDWASGADARTVLVLDGVTNPANVGMMLRTATAAGVDGVVVPRRGCAELGPLVVKASAGVAFRAPILHARTALDAIDELCEHTFDIVGLRAGSQTEPLFTSPLPSRAAIVVGSEHDGVSPDVAALVDRWFAIPLAGGVESLNAAMAAGLAVYEFARRRDPLP